MIRILAVGNLDQLSCLILGLAEEKIVRHVDYADNESIACQIIRGEKYDLVVLEPGLGYDDVRRVAKSIRNAANMRVCIIVPMDAFIGYAAGTELEIDFIVENSPRRIIEAYQRFEDGPDDI